jgi:hypothetical protein
VVHHSKFGSRLTAMGQNRRYRIPTWESALTSNSGR